VVFCIAKCISLLGEGCFGVVKKISPSGGGEIFFIATPPPRLKSKSEGVLLWGRGFCYELWCTGGNLLMKDM